MSERDLFKAIVLSGAALVAPGCGSPTTPADTGTAQNDAADEDDAGRDAGSDANDLLDDDAGGDVDMGMPAIL